MTHAIEGYFSTTATPFTDSYALYSTHLIAENLPIAVKEGSTLEARCNMLMASAMAITAFGFGNNGVPDTFAEFNFDSNVLQCIVDEVQSDSASARFLIPAM
ncbi:iron-containing alcohol dehydrogenase [Peribacillus butanolivorans]|uniref:iron-containing alcohol dehydrogenase n=1 Tax=Peribacillus butanolivorans TaxID=421767 RepID=UPI00207CC879|nr:iron-containing alcohol dehydrogenase [Peribacillus butanolivorans]MCO0600103.1 iron-containing alcohol dehydrogenase [Peribacillus butanolivorans]